MLQATQSMAGTKTHIARIGYNLLDKSKFLDGFIRFVEETGVTETQVGGIPIQEFYAVYVTFCEDNCLPVYSDSWVGVRMSQCGLRSIRKGKVGTFPVRMDPPNPAAPRKTTPHAILLREQVKLLEAEAAALRKQIASTVEKLEALLKQGLIGDDAYLELMIALERNTK